MQLSIMKDQKAYAGAEEFFQMKRLADDCGISCKRRGKVEKINVNVGKNRKWRGRAHRGPGKEGAGREDFSETCKAKGDFSRNPSRYGILRNIEESSGEISRKSKMAERMRGRETDPCRWWTKDRNSDPERRVRGRREGRKKETRKGIEPNMKKGKSWTCDTVEKMQLLSDICS